MTGKARASSTKTYTAVTSFNEFEAGHTYEMRETDAKVWVDMGHLRLASEVEAARFGGGDAGAVHDEGAAGAAGPGPGAGS